MELRLSLVSCAGQALAIPSDTDTSDVPNSNTDSLGSEKLAFSFSWHAWLCKLSLRCIGQTYMPPGAPPLLP